MTDFVVSTDLIVLGMSFFDGGQTFDGQTIIDVDSAEALLIRQDGDSGDVFIVNTNTPSVTLPQANSFISLGPNTAASGDIRFANTRFIAWRNTNNNGDLQVLSVDEDDILNIGSSGLGSIRFLNDTVSIFGAAAALTLQAVTLAHASGILTISAQASGVNANSYALLNEAAADDNPTLIPRRADITTGIGGADAEGNSGLSIVIEASKKLEVFNTSATWRSLTSGVNFLTHVFINGANDQIQLRVQAHTTQNGAIFTVEQSDGTDLFTISNAGQVSGGLSLSYALLNETSSATNPTLIPNRADLTTGIAAATGEGTTLYLVVAGTHRVEFNPTTMIVSVDAVINSRLDILGDGTDQVTLLVRGFNGQTLDVLQVKAAIPGIVDVLTVDQSGVTTLGEGLPSPIDALVLDSAALTGDGQRDSHAILLTGKGFETATPHDIDWKTFVDVTADDGTGSIWTLQTRIDGAGFVDKLTINDAGLATLNGNLVVGATNPAQSGSIRLPNTGSIVFRNSANNADLTALNIAATNFLEIGLSGTPWPRITAYTSLFWVSGGRHRVTDDSTAAFEVQSATPVAVIFGVDTINDIVTIGGNLTVSGAGPHAIGGTPSGIIGLIISETFTSDGSGTLASGVFVTQTLVGASGDTTSLTGFTFVSAITTQTATESIANISQVEINEPFITDNLTGSIGSAQSLLITGAPTEGNANWALKIVSGDVNFGGDLLEIGTGGGDIDILFRGCSTFFMGTLASPEEMFFGIGSTVSTANASMSLAQNVRFRLRSQFGDFSEVKRVAQVFLLSSGSSVTVALIPAGSFVVGITARVTTAVTGPTGFDIGDGIDVDRWGNSIAVGLGTTVDITDYTAAELTLFPTVNDIVITSDGVDFTGGAVRIVVHYMSLSAPTS